MHSEVRFLPGMAGELIPLGDFNIDYGCTAFSVHTAHSGPIVQREFYPEADLIYKPGYDLFRYADRTRSIPMVASDIEMSFLRVNENTLGELMGADIAEQLLDKLGLTPPPVVKVLPIPLHVSAPLRACISPTLTGSLKKLFAQAKTLEYLCALSTHVCVQAVEAPQVNRRRKAVRELREYLVQLEGKLPTLEELTVRYGISARWLNEAFEREYGQTIYAFITDHRLNEAHVALKEGNLPIKTIAARLGYSHANHFTIAFKKKFGYPPGSLRKGGTVELG